MKRTSMKEVVPAPYGSKQADFDRRVQYPMLFRGLWARTV